MPSHKGIVHEESYLPPANITIRSLGERYLCDGVRSVCWACECADHCEYGRIYCRMLRERVKKQKHGWRGYELADTVVTLNIIDQFSEGHPGSYVTALETRILPA